MSTSGMRRVWHGLGPCSDPTAVAVIQPRKMLPVSGSYREAEPEDCREYVYASPSKDVALAFSTLSGGSCVCEVDSGALPAEVDADFPRLGVRFRGPVKVLSVERVARSGLPDARRIVEILSEDLLWEDGSPKYSSGGLLRISPRFRQWGYVESDFEWLGPWFPDQFLMERQSDGVIAAFDESARAYLMFPPNHPDLKGRRRLPLGSLAEAWREPGYSPSATDLRQINEVQAKWNADEFKPVRAPWEW